MQESGQIRIGQQPAWRAQCAVQPQAAGEAEAGQALDAPGAAEGAADPVLDGFEAGALFGHEFQHHRP